MISLAHELFMSEYYTLTLRESLRSVTVPFVANMESEIESIISPNPQICCN